MYPGELYHFQIQELTCPCRSQSRGFLVLRPLSPSPPSPLLFPGKKGEPQDINIRQLRSFGQQRQLGRGILHLATVHSPLRATILLFRCPEVPALLSLLNIIAVEYIGILFSLPCCIQQQRASQAGPQKLWNNVIYFINFKALKLALHFVLYRVFWSPAYLDNICIVLRKSRAFEVLARFCHIKQDIPIYTANIQANLLNVAKYYQSLFRKM